METCLFPHGFYQHKRVENVTSWGNFIPISCRRDICDWFTTGVVHLFWISKLLSKYVIKWDSSMADDKCGTNVEWDREGEMKFSVYFNALCGTDGSFFKKPVSSDGAITILKQMKNVMSTIAKIFLSMLRMIK